MTTSGDKIAPLTVLLFGPMQVLVHGDPLPHLRSSKALWLLALLTLRQDRAVQREWLAGTLWPEVEQRRASANLRVVLSELRRALGSEGERLLRPTRHTISLDLAGADVDVSAFDAAMSGNQWGEMDSAVGLYRGPLLEGCKEEWAVLERRVRERECLRALMMLADDSLAAERREAAARYYQRAIELDPWEETAQRGLMRALAMSGDGNAALSAYRAFAGLLRKDDPRAMPDEATTALYTQLRAEARQGAAAPAAVIPQNNKAPKAPGYLPQPLTDLIGREDEQAAIAQRMLTSRLVTLTGPGGVGKTRLAIAVATSAAPQFADGVWMATLETLSDGAGLAERIAGVLKIKSKSEQPQMENLIDYLRPKDLLLVLDNCEHLLDAVSQDASRLLRECGGVRVLATSREALRVTGEVAWQVPSLSAPDPAHLPQSPAALRQALMGYESVQLFVERAQAARRDFSLTAANAPAVAEICARLEGTPLAIELAAARVRAMTAEQIAARLDDYLNLLGVGGRAAMSRQQTMRATLDWSYALLDAQEQILLSRLSVFSGGWPLEAAEAVCGGDGIEPNQVLDLLTSLVDKSLVTFGGQGADEGAARYWMLETVRQYGDERLRTSESYERARERHWEWCLALAEESEPHLIDTKQTSRRPEILRRLDREYDNLRSALNWSAARPQLAETHLRITSLLFHFWRLRGLHREGRKYLEEALKHEGAQERTITRAKALRGTGLLAYQQNNYQIAYGFLEESVSISKQCGDQPENAKALQLLGHAAMILDDSAKAMACFEERLGVSRSLDDREGIATALGAIGSLAWRLRNFVLAREAGEESESIYRELGIKAGIAQALGNLARLATAQYDYDKAIWLEEERLSLYRELDDRYGLCFSLTSLSFLLRPRGEYVRAQELSEESLRVARKMANRRSVATSLITLGSATHYLGGYEEAQALFEESLSIALELQDAHTLGWSYRGLGHAAFQRGDYPTAQEFHRQSLPIWRDLEDKKEIAETLNDLAIVQATQGQIQEAARLWGAVETLRENIGMSLPACDREMYRREVEQASVALGADAFAAAWSSGQALDWDQAVADALKSGPPLSEAPAPNL